MGKNKRLYVLDTNVLMHDPTSMFRFQEHDVFLPMIVLEELDVNLVDDLTGFFPQITRITQIFECESVKIEILRDGTEQWWA